MYDDAIASGGGWEAFDPMGCNQHCRLGTSDASTITTKQREGAGTIVRVFQAFPGLTGYAG